jgi:hypothetical protein
MFSGCDRPGAFDCVKTTGAIVTETRVPPPFSWIIVDDNIDVLLNNDSTGTITVEGGENLIGKLSWEHLGDTLRIYNGNYCNWARSYENRIKVTLGASPLTAIVHKSYGKISSVEKLRITDLTLFVLEANGNVDLEMKANYFFFYTNCSPSVQLKGETNHFGVWSREFARIEGEGLVAQVCDINNASANEIRTFPVQKLNARIEQSGNIVYYNEPQTIEQVILGTGKLIRK